MIKIINSKISSDIDLMGEQLRQAREDRRIKLEDAAAKLQISIRYLSALENGRLEELPAGIYGRKFLREYGDFLGVNTQGMLESPEIASPARNNDNNKQLFSVEKTRPRQFLAVPRIAKGIAVALVALACLGYLGVCFKRVTAVPILIVNTPADNMRVEENSLEISGIAEPEARISVNGEFVLADADGNFSKTINLKTGLNTIMVTAQKQYSRTNTVTRNVLLKNPNL